VEAMGGVQSSQPLCGEEEEEEEKPSCGSPQPIPAPSVAGDSRQETPLLRVADNPPDTCGAGDGYQTPGETGESEGRGKSS